MNDSCDPKRALDDGSGGGEIGLIPFDLSKMRTPAQAAVAINKSPSTLSAWRKQQINLPYYRNGSRIYYHIDDIEQYVRGCRVEVRPLTGVRVDAIRR